VQQLYVGGGTPSRRDGRLDRRNPPSFLGFAFELEAIKLDPAPPPELGRMKLAFEYRQGDFTLQ
jgi:hypothetical protein